MSYISPVRVVEDMCGTAVVTRTAVVMTAVISAIIISAIVAGIVVVRIVSVIERAVPVVIVGRAVIPGRIVVRAVVDVPVEGVIPAIVERIPTECPYYVTVIDTAAQ